MIQTMLGRIDLAVLGAASINWPVKADPLFRMSLMAAKQNALICAGSVAAKKAPSKALADPLIKAIELCRIMPAVLDTR